MVGESVGVGLYGTRGNSYTLASGYTFLSSMTIFTAQRLVCVCVCQRSVRFGTLENQHQADLVPEQI